MVKNAEILEAFERKFSQDKHSGHPEDWYKKADALYDLALKLNPDVINTGGDAHVEMLIDVRKKFRAISKK